MNKFLHIGLGKASSSHLQEYIFPKITKHLSLRYVSNKYSNHIKDYQIEFKAKLSSHEHKSYLNHEIYKIELGENILCSSEGLSSYREPQYFERFAENNLKAFGKDAIIILVIRNPKDFLNSIWSQCCIYEKPLQEPEHFFLTDNEYSENLPNSTFKITAFSYEKLINFYSSRFNKVYVIKHEYLGKCDWVEEIFKINDEKVINELKKIYKIKKVNKRATILQYNLLKKFSKFLNYFSFDYRAKFSNKVFLNRISIENTKKETNIGEKIRSKKFFSLSIFIKRLVSRISRNIDYFSFVNIFLLNKKYVELNFDQLKKINIKYLENEYENIKSISIYNNDNKP